MNRFSLLILFFLAVPGFSEEMRVSLGKGAYAGGFDALWTSLNPSESHSGKLKADKKVHELRDADKGSLSSITLKLSPPKQATLDQVTSDRVDAKRFKQLGHEWVDEKANPQRETFSIKHGSGAWTLTLSGFDPEDTVRVDMVFLRDGKSGKRLVTVTGPENAVWVNEADVVEGVSVEGGPMTGKEVYAIRIEPVGDGWSCLPNVIRVRRKPRPSRTGKPKSRTYGPHPLGRYPIPALAGWAVGEPDLWSSPGWICPNSSPCGLS